MCPHSLKESISERFFRCCTVTYNYPVASLHHISLHSPSFHWWRKYRTITSNHGPQGVHQQSPWSRDLTCHSVYQSYVTVFWKTDCMDTNTEIHFLPVDESHTRALFRDTKHLRLDGQVCFYRRLFPML